MHDYKIPGRNAEILDSVDPKLVEEGANAFANELMCSQCAFVHGAKMLGFDEDQALLASSGFGWGTQHGEQVMGYAISILEDLLNDTSDDASLIHKE